MSGPKTNDEPSCEEAHDEILAARCEERCLPPEFALHVDACDACRNMKSQIASFSPEALAYLVLMRGISSDQ